MKQIQKANNFRALHKRTKPFIIPNPYDAGTAKLLSHLGFEALATTSAGMAFTFGKRDNTVNSEQVLRHFVEIASATDLPVSADLGNGFGDSPETVAETIRLAGLTGIVGGSVEDMSSNKNDPIYDFELAVERVRAAVEAKSALPFDFILTARAENYLVGRTDLKDTIKRLQAFDEAGADVLFAPGLKSKDEIKAVVESVDRPVNVIAGLPDMKLSVADLSEIGVKRISVGSTLARVALGAFLCAAKGMKTNGTFEFSDETLSFKDISEIFEE